MENKIPCTIYILTLNSEKLLPRALNSVKDFAEILVCDGNSTDSTLEIAEKFGAKIIKQTDSNEANQKISDFAAVRTKCIREASHDWIFQLDSDEELPSETKAEIQNIISVPIKYYAYKVPSRIIYRGKLIKYATSYPGYQLRFFNRLSGAKYERNPHSRLVFDTNKYPISVLKNPWYVFQEDDDLGTVRPEFVDLEVLSARNQNLVQFFRWSIFNRALKIIKSLIKFVLLYSSHGLKDTLPPRVEFTKIRYAFAVMFGTIKDRMSGK